MSEAFDPYRDSYESVVENSVAFSGLKHDFFMTAKIRLISRLFKNHFGEGVRPSLLDVGCGVGRIHPLLSPIAGPLSGTDISGEAIGRARSDNPGLEYRVGRPGALPFADETFDATTAICVLHHVPPALRSTFLAEICRVTRSGGLVVVIEHNPWNPLTRLAVFRCPFDRDAVLLGAGETRALLVKAGLKSISSSHFLLLPSFATAARRTEKLFSSLPFGAQYATIGTI